MRSDVLRRVRWTNVTLALGTLALLTTVIAWPLMTAPPPTLPADTARPLWEPGVLGEEGPAGDGRGESGPDAGGRGEGGRGEDGRGTEGSEAASGEGARGEAA